MGKNDTGFSVEELMDGIALLKRKQAHKPKKAAGVAKRSTLANQMQINDDGMVNAHV